MKSVIAPLIEISPDMMLRAEHEAGLQSWAWGKGTTNFNDARDVVGSLGEQCFNQYLGELGLTEGLDYTYDRVTLDNLKGDSWDFMFSSGETLDVKTSTSGYDLLVKEEAVRNRPCDYYVQANLWRVDPPKLQLTGYATKKQLRNRQPRMVLALDYVVQERYLKHVDYFRRYKNVSED